jgi:hypothetical protein
MARSDYTKVDDASWILSLWCEMKFNFPNVLLAIVVGNVIFFSMLKASESVGIRIPVLLAIILSTVISTFLLVGFHYLHDHYKK